MRCRQIEERDFGAVASLLANGFRTRDEKFWLEAFAQLRRHATPEGLPKYGYLLESGNRAVGAVLMICSLVPAGDKDVRRCNLSSWYVDPAFRAYAPLLVSQALRHKDVTYVNVSSRRKASRAIARASWWRCRYSAVGPAERKSRCSTERASRQ